MSAADDGEVRVRAATREDLPVLITLHEALYIKHQDAITPEGVGELLAYRDFDTVLRRDISGLVSDREGIVLVAEIGTDIVGYITGHVVHESQRVLPRRGVVEDWLVIEAARARGVGAILMGAIEGTFRERGCDVVESATWAFNTGAVAAHEALGYRQFQVRFRKRLGDE